MICVKYLNFYSHVPQKLIRQQTYPLCYARGGEEIFKILRVPLVWPYRLLLTQILPMHIAFVDGERWWVLSKIMDVHGLRGPSDSNWLI